MRVPRDTAGELPRDDNDDDGEDDDDDDDEEALGFLPLAKNMRNCTTTSMWQACRSENVSPVWTHMHKTDYSPVE